MNPAVRPQFKTSLPHQVLPMKSNQKYPVWLFRVKSSEKGSVGHLLFPCSCRKQARMAIIPTAIGPWGETDGRQCQDNGAERCIGAIHQPLTWVYCPYLGEKLLDSLSYYFGFLSYMQPNLMITDSIVCVLFLKNRSTSFASCFSKYSWLHFLHL